MPSATDPDNPQMKAAWEAFLSDLEEEALAYTDEIVATFQQIRSEEGESALAEVTRILHEANPHHDSRGRFSRGGGGGRKAQGPPSTGAAPTTGRMSATVGSVNTILKGDNHPYKAVSLKHGGVRLTHTGKLAGAAEHRAHSDALQALERHGAVLRTTKTGEVHITHFQNASSIAASGHVARVRQKRGDPKPAPQKSAADVRKEMLEWDDKRTADITVAAKLRDEKNREFRTAAEKLWLAENDKQHPLRPWRERLKADKDRLMKETKEASDKWHELVHKRDQELKEKFIYQKPSDRYDMELQQGVNIGPTQRGDWERGFDEFRKIIGPSMDKIADDHANMIKNIPAAQRKEIGIKERATVYFGVTEDKRAFNRAGVVFMSRQSRGDDAATVVHELGHSLEFHVPEVAASRRRFYDERTRGEAEVSLKKHTGHNYEEHEMSKVDDFVHPYMGKDYKAPATNDRYSEMVSMGVEMLSTGPVKLARQDPEYFDWIYDVTRGRAASHRPAPRMTIGDTVKITGGPHKGKRGDLHIRKEGGAWEIRLPGDYYYNVDKGDIELVNPR